MASKAFKFRVNVKHDGKDYPAGTVCPASLVETMLSQGLVIAVDGAQAASVAVPVGESLEADSEVSEGDPDAAEADVEGEDEEAEESEQAEKKPATKKAATKKKAS